MSIRRRELSKSVLLVFGVLAIAVAGHYYVGKRDVEYREKVVNGDFEKALGQFVGVSNGGESGVPELVYSYEFKGEYYERLIRVKNRRKDVLSECFRNEGNCQEYRFWVILLKDSPEMSLIDLSCISTGSNQCVFPGDLSSFR
ncbi:MAG: hypothetical protein RIE86_12550 [Imperialibacter sp.]|uniref:hypothetical protein n=1 Tax=Imperialibacter sp. TaxID=2038411 RepID=UPI0032ED82AA